MAAWSGELALAFSLADRADTVSLSHFTSADLTTVHETVTRPVVLPTGATHVQGRLGRCDVLEPVLVGERQHLLEERAAQAALAQQLSGRFGRN